VLNSVIKRKRQSVSNFKAIVINMTDSGQSAALMDFDEAALMDGDVTFRVEWSTLN
jgi:acrylyl-CoA reductase (NADPH)